MDGGAGPRMSLRLAGRPLNLPPAAVGVAVLMAVLAPPLLLRCRAAARRVNHDALLAALLAALLLPAAEGRTAGSSSHVPYKSTVTEVSASSASASLHSSPSRKLTR